ncbi:hypothetical protein [Corynebacterium macginleyi]|uniref:hypothetical protein n=1 Tax=Corynebacterium macginleyi TaxID=38290 RepID=UPI00190AB4F2|nr:hypothetical protein [Corynebacterium macginleyi]MBK4183177.1 hypothetical protein [Corynebacterium macginleyi]
MTYLNNNEVRGIRDRLKDYEMCVTYADGVYRHLRFYSTTDPYPGNCSFDVVTWPGHAWIGGDWCRGYTISRENDMLTDFLDVLNISYGYWAEKMRLTSDVPIKRRSVLAYEKWVRDTAQEIAADYELCESDTQDIIEEYISLVDPDHPNVVSWGVLESLESMEFDVDRRLGKVVEVPLAISDAWELDFDEYTYGFLVACEGLRFAAEKWASHAEENR